MKLLLCLCEFNLWRTVTLCPLHPSHFVHVGQKKNAPNKISALNWVLRLLMTIYRFSFVFMTSLHGKLILSLSTTQIQLEFPLHGFQLPLTCKFIHLYIDLEPNMFLFLTSELLKLQKNFGHLSAQKQCRALQPAYSRDKNRSNLEKLKSILQNCHACINYSRWPNR